jgi:hypothetical protein
MTLIAQIRQAETAEAVCTAVDQWRFAEIFHTTDLTIGEREALRAIQNVNSLLKAAIEQAETEGNTHGQQILMAAVRAAVEEFIAE